MICRLIFVATLMVWVFILTGCTESRTAIPADAAASHDGMDGGSGFPDLGGGPDLEQDLWSPNPDSSPDLYSPDQHIPDAMQPDSVQPDAMQPDVLPDDACSPQTFYLDGDGDGYGDSKKTTFACRAWYPGFVSRRPGTKSIVWTRNWARNSHSRTITNSVS